MIMLDTGRWWRSRRRTAHGKETAPVAGLGFWMYSCFILGMMIHLIFWCDSSIISMISQFMGLCNLQ